ncbi:MAG TPA: hypothetical protein VFV87_18870, partial [Pirellulaceae bacterium]|nr:hypothetical protein [Pirellulaceae bacterium]
MNGKKRNWLVTLAASLALLAGCAPRPAANSSPNAKPAGSGGEATSVDDSSNAKPAADYTASEILQRLLATYRGAKSYQD